MKKRYLISSLLLSMGLLAGGLAINMDVEDVNAAAASTETALSTYTYEMTKDCLKTGDNTLGGVVWNLALEGSTYIGWDSYAGKGVQLGKNKEVAKKIVLSTTGFTKEIKKVTVNTSGAKDIANTTVTVDINGTAFGTAAAITSTATDYSFEGSGTGKLSLTWATPNKGVYLKSISVSYVDDAAPEAGVTLDKPAVTMYEGQKQTLTASINNYAGWAADAVTYTWKVNSGAEFVEMKAEANKVTISGLKAGAAEVQVTASDGTNTVVAKSNVTVKAIIDLDTHIEEFVAKNEGAPVRGTLKLTNLPTFEEYIKNDKPSGTYKNITLIATAKDGTKVTMYVKGYHLGNIGEENTFYDYLHAVKVGEEFYYEGTVAAHDGKAQLAPEKFYQFSILDSKVNPLLSALHLVEGEEGYFDDSVKDKNDACKESYAAAKELYDGLSDADKVLFAHNNAYKLANARYEAWKAANNDVATASGSVATSNDTTIIIVSVSVLAVAILGAAVLLLKRRQNA